MRSDANRGVPTSVDTVQVRVRNTVRKTVWETTAIRCGGVGLCPGFGRRFSNGRAFDVGRTKNHEAGLRDDFCCRLVAVYVETDEVRL